MGDELSNRFYRFTMRYGDIRRKGCRWEDKFVEGIIYDALTFLNSGGEYELQVSEQKDDLITADTGLIDDLLSSDKWFEKEAKKESSVPIPQSGMRR